MVENPDLWRALLPVVEALEEMGVAYHVGGSVASSFTGIARATQDADLVADLELPHVTPFTTALTDLYYLDRERVEQAVRTRRSFNAIHLPTMYKVDVFVAKDTPFARENTARRVAIEVPGLGRSLYFASPEDIVLHNLLWYTDGGGVSDRQWHDLQGVLRLRRASIDLAYLRDWAARLGIYELLEKAVEEADL